MPSSWLHDKRVKWLAGAAAVLVSATAVALPWDIDMADSQAKKAYSFQMTPPPAGAVAQPNILTPRDLPRDLPTSSPEAQALKNPYEVDADLLQTGQVMYNTYCWPCHGNDAKLGPVAQPGRFTQGLVLPIIGTGSTVKVRSDGFLYSLIRNGGTNMPSYGFAMNNREIWSIVAYLRTFPGNRYILAQ